MAEPVSDPISAESEHLMLHGLVDGFAGDDPLMLELLMAAALPRSFDLDTLAAMLQRPREDPDLVAALDRLTSHALVEERANGQFALHDLIRSDVAARWLEPERTAQREQLLGRLREHYDQAYARAREAATALAEVGVLMRQVRPQRYLACLERIEDQLVRPAVESVLAAVLISTADGWQQFTQTFTEQEEQRRYRICELLITAYADAARLVAAEQRPLHQGWVTYFLARLANDREQWQQSQQLLETIDVTLFADHRFEAWVKQTSAVSLRGQCRFTEAISVLDEVVALNDRYHEDDYNAVVAFSTKAQIHQQVWDGQAEVEASYAGIGNAEQFDNPRAGLQVRFGLIGSFSTSGEPARAIIELMAGMRQTRLELGTDASVSRWFSAQALTFLGIRSRRLFATLAEQYRQLSQFSWPNGELDVLLAEAPTLRDGGDMAAAAAVYELASALATEHLPDRLWEVDSDWAGSAADLGQPVAGAQANLAILANPLWNVDPWMVVRCLSNAGDSYLRAHQLQPALDCLRQAEAKWTEMSHRRATSWTRAQQAEALRQQGDIAGALAMVDALVIEPSRGYEASVLLNRSLTRRDGLRFAEAADDARQAAISFELQGQRVTAVRSWLVVLDCLLDAGRQVELADAAAQLRRLVAELAAYTSWTSTAEQELADEHAGRAIRILIDGRGSMPNRRRAAREHLDYAIELDRDNAWFLIERAFVELAQGAQPEADRSLVLALARTDDPVLSDGITALRTSLRTGTPLDARSAPAAR